MSNGKFAAGQLVLVPDSRLICRPCCVVKCNGYPPRMTITLEPIEGGPRFSPSEGDAALISEVDPLALEGTADLVKLSHLNEFAILQNLRARYARDEIYTAVGTILMAVNPFKDVSSGDDSVLQRACTADAKAWDELPPHVYVLAENAYRAALRERKPQAILISGESGAGKTESTKLWLHHLVKRSARAGGGSGGTASHIETALLHCNPVLETFGNAATTRNTNSSRFGKWIEVSLDARAGGTISSARLTSYLLERSRVTGHAPGERAFHAFYQLLAAVGSGKGVNGKLALEADPAKYRYMRAGADGSGVAAAVRREDAERRATCVRSLQALGFAQAQLESLDAVVASVLHLGNVSFESHNAGEHQDEGAAIAASARAHVGHAAELLGVDAEAVSDALTVRLVGRFPAVRVPLSVASAGAQRDALARALYTALFDEHLFTELNRKMHGLSEGSAPPELTTASSAGEGLYVGCLDIFGFECFALNGLEQLLINYANERLHHLFNVHVFEMDVAQLTLDGIELLSRDSALVYGENAATLTLLHGGPGAGGGNLLSLLSEEVTLPKGSDANYLEKCIGALKPSSSFLAPRGGCSEMQFGVKHYAGPVSYSVNGFVEKNRNAVPTDLVTLLAGSTVPLLAAVFGEMKRAADSAAAGAGGGARTRAAAGAGGRKPAGRGASAAALSAVFTRSLDSLLERLSGTSLHFVRCVKPNATLAPDTLDADFALVQLRYMGMLAVAEVRKRGYAHRMGHALFLERYAMLMPAAERADMFGASDGERRGVCERFFAQQQGGLAAEAKKSADGMQPFAIGRSLVCMRGPLHAAMEGAREGAVRSQLLERVRLEAGAAKPDLTRLQEVVSLALEVGLDADPAVQHALKMLRILREREEVTAALNSLVAHGAGADVVRLEQLLVRGRELGVDSALVSRAEALLQRARGAAQTEAKLRAMLRQGCVGEQAVRELEVLIGEAAKLEVSQELIQQARREAEAARERERVLGALRAAVQKMKLPLSDADADSLLELLSRASVIGIAQEPDVQAAQGRLDEDDERRRRVEVEPASLLPPPPGLPVLPTMASEDSFETESPASPLKGLGEGRTRQIAPFCMPISQRLAQLEAGMVRASCFVPTECDEYALVQGTLSLSPDHLTLCWTPDTISKKPGSASRLTSSSGLRALFGAVGIGSEKGDVPAGEGARASSIIMPILNLSSISIGPQSAETLAALKRAQIESVRGLFAYNVIALICADGKGHAERHEFAVEDSEDALLAVGTIEELAVRYSAPAGCRGEFGALQRAQSQWFMNAHDRGALLLPLIRALFDMLEAAATWLRIDQIEPQMLWLLVEMVEVPLPPGLVWVPVDPSRAGYALRRVAVCDEASGALLDGHPYESHFRAKVDRHRHGGPAAAHHLLTDPQQLIEDSLAWRGRVPAAAATARAPEPLAGRGRQASRQAAPPGLQIYQAILSGSVDAVQRYLDMGGPVDAYYRTEWGFQGVGSDWAWAQPTAGTTPLNYVCTLLDVIGDEVAADMARALLDAGADPLRDDCLQKWFLPIHNAASNGGPETVGELLRKEPGLANQTTGEGQSTLFAAALCERAADRRKVVQLLLQHGAATAFAEPYFGETALHTFASSGHATEVALLCDAGADPRAQSYAGETPGAVSERVLDELLSGVEASIDGGGGSSLEERVNGLTNVIELLRGLIDVRAGR